MVYGAGGTGKRIVAFLENNGCKKNIKCFCDQNSDIWGSFLEGILVLSPEEAVREYNNAHFLVGGDYADQILKELVAFGISKIHLLLLY